MRASIDKYNSDYGRLDSLITRLEQWEEGGHKIVDKRFFETYGMRYVLRKSDYAYANYDLFISSSCLVKLDNRETWHIASRLRNELEWRRVAVNELTKGIEGLAKLDLDEIIAEITEVYNKRGCFDGETWRLILREHPIQYPNEKIIN